MCVLPVLFFLPHTMVFARRKTEAYVGACQPIPQSGINIAHTSISPALGLDHTIATKPSSSHTASRLPMSKSCSQTWQCFGPAGSKVCLSSPVVPVAHSLESNQVFLFLSVQQGSQSIMLSWRTTGLFTGLSKSESCLQNMFNIF